MIRTIPVEISARHIHLTEADWQKLFATPHPVPKVMISQPPQFVAVERVSLRGDKGVIPHVGIVGPLRAYSQVELAMSDAVRLGIHPPLSSSGHVSEAVSVTVIGSKGEITLPIAIIQQRHIHASPAEANAAGLRDGEEVSLRFSGRRGGQLDHVVVRVHPSFAWHAHLDTDEANALGVTAETIATIIIPA